MLRYRDKTSPSTSYAILLTILLLESLLLVSICILDSHFNNFMSLSNSSRELFSGKSENILSHRQDIISLYNPFYDDNDKYYVYNSIKAYVWLSTLVSKMQGAHASTHKSYEELYDQYIQTFPNKDFKTISIEPENNPFINGYQHRLFYRHESQQLSTLLMVSDSDTRPKHCIITFLGTKSTEDAMTDLNLGYFSNAEIHQEFEQVAINQMSDMTRALNEDLKMEWNAFDTITINGHSLGGGLAVITGYFLHRDYKVNKMEIITFGAPRVFKETRAGNERWRSFVEAVENKDKEKKIKMLRFYHEWDKVPKLPPANLGYIHVGTGIEMKESYWRTKCNQVLVGASVIYCHKMDTSYLPYIHALF